MKSPAIVKKREEISIPSPVVLAQLPGAIEQACEIILKVPSWLQDNVKTNDKIDIYVPHS